MSTLGSLAVSIIGDSRQLDKALDGVTKKVQGFGKNLQTMGGNMVSAGTSMTTAFTLPLIAAATGLVAITTKAGNYADELLDLSAVTGVHTDQLQRWRYMAVSAGTDTDAVANALSRMNRQMVDGTEFGQRLEKTAEAYGVALRDANGEVRDSTDVITDLMVSIAGIEDPAERARAGAQAFGRDWTAIAPIVDLGTEAIQRWNEQEVITREKLERANEFRQAWDEMKNSIALTAMELGFNLIPLMEDFTTLIQEKVIPWLEKQVEKLGELIEKFLALDPWIQQLTVGFLALLGASGPVLVVVGTLVKAIGAILGVLTAKVLLIGLVIAAVVAIGIAIYKWVSENEEVKARVMEAWETIKTALEGVWEALQELAEVVTEKIQEFWAEHGEAILAALEVVWDMIVLVVETAIKAVEGVIRIITAIIQGDWEKAWEIVKETFSTVMETVLTIGETLMTALLSVLSTIWENIKAKASEIWESIKLAIYLKATQIYDDTKAKLEELWEYIKGIPGNAMQWGKDILQKFWDGLKAKWDSLKQGVKDIAEDIKNFFNPWARQSPSLIDNIRSGVAEIEKLYSNISLPTNGLNTAAGPLAAIGAGGGGMQTITMNITYHVDSTQTAEHANSDLIRKIQLRGGGRL
jgi:phage-related protein